MDIGEVGSNQVEGFEIVGGWIGRGNIHTQESKRIRVNKLHFGQGWCENNDSNATLGVAKVAR
jgi:hypothetical protein